jgi:hypothetical protein
MSAIWKHGDPRLTLADRGNGSLPALPHSSLSEYTIMTIQTVPLTLPPSADPSKFVSFGREVIGVDPGNLSSSDFAEIRQLLYKVQ